MVDKIGSMRFPSEPTAPGILWAVFQWIFHPFEFIESFFIFLIIVGFFGSRLYYGKVNFKRIVSTIGKIIACLPLTFITFLFATKDDPQIVIIAGIAITLSIALIAVGLALIIISMCIPDNNETNYKQH